MRTFTSFFLVLITFSLAGCNSGGASESSGQSLGELSSAEIDTLCDELHGYAMRTWNGACTEEGLSAEVVQSRSSIKERSRVASA